MFDEIDCRRWKAFADDVDGLMGGMFMFGIGRVWILDSKES